MAQRVFFLNRLRDGVSPADYEDWVRRVDYPVARRQPAIRSYVVTRLDGLVTADGEPPYQYLEVIEITNIDDYRSSLSGNPELESLLQEWSEYVGESVAVYGETVDD
jgi:hypothetical protein